MTESAQPGRIGPPRKWVGMLTPHSVNSIGAQITGTWNTADASAVWPTAAKAIYVPFELAEPLTVVKGFWLNGATAAGNIDIGIYKEDGTKVVSMGNTAQGTVNIIQEVDITDTFLPAPARYFMGLACSLGTATLFSIAPTAPICKAWGIYTQATASPLPSPATFALDATWAYVPLFGFSTQTRVV